MCKKCGYPIIGEECSHLICKTAYARGFCGYGCMRVWDAQNELRKVA